MLDCSLVAKLVFHSPKKNLRHDSGLLNSSAANPCITDKEKKDKKRKKTDAVDSEDAPGASQETPTPPATKLDQWIKECIKEIGNANRFKYELEGHRNQTELKTSLDTTVASVEKERR